MSLIFISFSSLNADLARSVSEEIKQRTGFETWVYHERLTGGDHWKPEIDEAIKEADAVVIVLTNAANQSLYVTYEWSFALGLGKPVIPVEFETVPKDKLHDKLSSMQWEKAAHERDWGKFITTLEQKIQTYRAYTIWVPREAPRVVQDTARLIDSADPAQRTDAIERLSDMDDASVVPILIQALSAVTPDVRQKAAEMLNELGDSRAISALLARMDDRVSQVRRAAIRALGRFNDISVLDALLSHMDKADEYEKHDILCSLGEIGNPSALPRIIKALNEDTDEPEFDSRLVRQGAQSALEEFGILAIEPLKAAFNDANEQMARIIMDTIARVAFGPEQTPIYVLVVSKAIRSTRAELKSAGLVALKDLTNRSSLARDIVTQWVIKSKSWHYANAKEIL